MATHVIEVACTTRTLVPPLTRVIDWLNDAQTATKIEKLEPSLFEPPVDGTRYVDEEVCVQLASHISRLGHHPRVILVTDRQLDGQNKPDLSSSVRAEARGDLLPVAIVTTKRFVRESRLPVEGYLCRELLYLSIRWMVATHERNTLGSDATLRPLLHDGSPETCPFHTSRPIELSVLQMTPCHNCLGRLREHLDRGEYQSLVNVTTRMSMAMGADDPDGAVETLLRQRREPVFMKFWGYIRTILEALIELYRQYGKGRAYYVTASLLSVGGLTILIPSFWQHVLLAIFDFELGDRPYDTFIGLTLVILSVVMFVIPQFKKQDNNKT